LPRYPLAGCCCGETCGKSGLTETQDSERLLLDLCHRSVNLTKEPDFGRVYPKGFC
jgi:hypothetical protein